MGLFNKKELQEIERLQLELDNANIKLQQIGAKEYFEVEECIKKKQEALATLNEKEEELNSKINELKNTISNLTTTLEKLELEVDMCDFGLYKPKFNCMTSEEYANRITEVRNKQKVLIKNKSALNFSEDWTLDGSKAKGQALNNDNMKMYLRAFNNECDVLISKVKFNNFDNVKDRIFKCATALNKLNTRNKISVKDSYLMLKIDELHLVHEYNCKKQEEKEAMRAAREEEREQARLQKEIEETRKTINKELTHYSNARNKLVSQLENADNDEKVLINQKLKEIDDQINEINKNLADIDYREANQKAGYVYVISNVGSFGEDVYKIGMTRRLNPQDRVDELGDASVPFTFDVHAMIFSDDAPKLEAALHKAFEKNKVNMINSRKEFFKVKLEDIEKVIHENHDKLIEINKVADAEQYKESLKLKEL